MNILVTVGTTQYDELIEYIDVRVSNHQITFQIASGSYKPINHKYFSFSDDFTKYVEKSDIVITHSGAGSVYSLLEMKKKIIVVPNLYRIDKHQKELASYVEKNDFAFVAWELEQLNVLIEAIDNKVFKEYVKDDFFKGHEIRRIINELF